MNQLEWTTEKKKVNDLLPLEINPRKISEEKMQSLKLSLEKFNLAEIPAINKDSTIIAGHQRIKALQFIGRGEEIIDVRIPNRQLTLKELKEYNLISNTHSGEWDFDLFDLHFSDIDIEAIGIDFSELRPSDLSTKEIDADPEPQEDDYEVPEEIITDIKRGDIIEFVSENTTHRLLCGDSTSFYDVEKLMQKTKADMIFTDPPYNVKVNNIVNLGKTKHNEFLMASGEMSAEEFISFLAATFELLISNSKDGSIHYICMDWKHIYEIITAGKIYTELKNLCVWNKDNGGMGTFYRSKHELIFVFKNGKEKHINNFELGQFGRYRTNVWDYAGQNSFSLRERTGSSTESVGDLKLHPTVKPVKLVGDAIIDCSNKGMSVMDMFLGSGTTMVACHQLKRKCYGMELDPRYCQVIVDRMNKLDTSIITKRNGTIWNIQKNFCEK